ncbi:amidohydrolase [Synergistales bacterium]|nr:amidohydrolase [Synergistales bacterium]
MMEQSTILLTADLLLEGIDLSARRGWGVAVQGDMIADIGPEAEVAARFPHAIREDFRNCCIMPGLIDCHNHLSWDCSIPDYPAKATATEAELAVIGMRNMMRDLKSGVTTSRYVGDKHFIDVLFRRLRKEGILTGPKMLVSGIGLRSGAGHGYVGMPFDGAEDIIKAVRANVIKNVDWIKFYATGTAPKGGKILSYYTKEEVNVIVDIAHRAGLPVTTHCIGGQGLLDAIECGVDCLEHVYFISDEELAKVQDAGVWVCLTVSEFLTDKPMMPDSMRPPLAERKQVRAHMERVIKSRVPYILGTDGMHGDLAMEAVYIVDMGASVQDALQALTVKAAKFLKIDGETGSLTKGKRADLLVAEGDILCDISSLKRVRSVYQDGVKVV